MRRSGVLVGMNYGSRFHTSANDGLDAGLSAIRNHASNHLTAALKRAHDDDSLSAFVAAFLLHAAFPVFVHIPSLSSDVGFIYFDFAAKHPASEIVLHRKAHAMEHEPCGLLGDTHSAVKLPRRNPILGICDEPNDGHPLLQTEGRVFENGSDLHGELALRMTGGTLPAPLSAQEANPITTASWAGNAVRPAPRHDVAQAVVRIREIDDSFLEGGWLFAHVSTL
jgi:hypothetical protein